MGIVVLSPATDPAEVDALVEAERGETHVQFTKTLPDGLLAAVADTIRRRPDVGVRAYGFELDSLAWLNGLEHVERLAVDLYKVKSFDEIAACTRLRSLSLSQTASQRPSLAFLAALPDLEELGIEGHAKGFDAVSSLGKLRGLTLRATRLRSLDALRGHPMLEWVDITLGGLRDLAPLVEVARLRGLGLWGIRLFETEHLDPLGECPGLAVVYLGALRRVRNLKALALGPGASLRVLGLEQVSGLDTLGDLAGCRALEEIGLWDARPGDRRLDVLLACPALRVLISGDVYPKGQLEALREGFGGEVLRVRGEALRGTARQGRVRWRMPVADTLAELS